MAEVRILTHPAVARARFEALTHLPDERLDLSEAALVVALEEYPGLDINAYVQQLDRWGGEVREKVPDLDDLERTIETINRLLFEVEGFHGDHGSACNPRSAFLNDVLDRHEGAAVSMAILYLELLRRLGVSGTAISFPGRLLVRVCRDGQELLIDPYDEGQWVGERECQELLDQLFGGAVRLRKDHLRQTSRRDLLGRLLAYLKSAFLSQRDLIGASAASERLLLIDDHDPYELRDRAQIAMQLHRYEEAIAALKRYLELAPFADDARNMRDQLLYLEAWLSQN